ncbi:MAG TPA: S41 family peptidase [Niabella sp.]|nr:S41 family peptidase [Niabella sp.]
MRAALIVLLLIQFFFIAGAQTKYTKQQLVEDLKVLKNILVHTNPILTNTGRENIEKKFTQTIRTFPMESATGLEFMRYISPLKTEIRYDDHAGMMLGEEHLPPGTPYFPLPVYIIQNNMLVNTEKGPLPYGSIIHGINGIKTSEILKDLAGNDGEANFRKYHLNDGFPFQFFTKYGAKDTFTISYKTNIDDTIEKQARCPAVGISELLNMQNSRIFPLNRNVEQDKINIYTQFDEPSKLCYMRVPSFLVLSPGSAATYEQFKNVFDSLFKEIRQKSVAHLIIDIRGNGGGLIDRTGLLFSYLADSVFHEAWYLKMQRVNHIPLQHLKAIDNNNVTSRVDAKKRLYRLYDGFTTTNGESKKTIELKREPNQYSSRGKVALLTDGGTFSAAAYFAALFRLHQRGDIIGAQVGGSIREMTAGHLLLYELPNTKIRLTIPLMYITFDKELYPAVKEEYISPDYAIPFATEYQYFLKKQDWDRGLNIKTKNQPLSTGYFAHPFMQKNKKLHI